MRIALLLALIFTAGVFTGRFTAPRPATLVIGPRGGVATAETALVRLTAEVNLDASEQARFRPILEEMAEKMSHVPPATPERRDLFLSYLPRFRVLLRPDQLAAVDRYAGETERRFDRNIRRRNRQ